MTQRLVLVLVLIMSQNVFSQELFARMGKNFTTYNYKNSQGVLNPNLRSWEGSNYELGYEFILDNSASSLDSDYSYSIGLMLNQFNSRGGNVNNNYEWRANYLGIHNVFYKSLIYSSQSIFNLKIKAGVNLSTIVQGEQSINNVIYDLKSHDEFKGLLVSPLAGFDFRLEITRELLFITSYSYLKSFNVSNKSDEKLGFSTHQIQFGLQYTLY